MGTRRHSIACATHQQGRPGAFWFLAQRSEPANNIRRNLMDRVRFVEEIDRTSVGKVDKKVLRQKYRE